MAKRKQLQELPSPPEDRNEAPAVVDPPGSPMPVVDEALAPDEVKEILASRARALAQAPVSSEAGKTIQVVVLSLGDGLYGVDTAYVENIYPLEGLTPIPCTPSFCVGVVNLRGRILSVIDLHQFMGLSSIPIDGNSQVVAVNASGLEVGLLASEVREVASLNLDKLEPALPTTARIAAEYTRGVSSDMLVLLDLPALLKDPRIIIQEES